MEKLKGFLGLSNNNNNNTTIGVGVGNSHNPIYSKGNKVIEKGNITN